MFLLPIKKNAKIPNLKFDTRILNKTFLISKRTRKQKALKPPRTTRTRPWPMAARRHSYDQNPTGRGKATTTSVLARAAEKLREPWCRPSGRIGSGRGGCRWSRSGRALGLRRSRFRCWGCGMGLWRCMSWSSCGSLEPRSGIACCTGTLCIMESQCQRSIESILVNTYFSSLF